ncbi:MAG: hypothetical protein OHK0013_31630 [Sandaracinaceae bacterium]
MSSTFRALDAGPPFAGFQKCSEVSVEVANVQYFSTSSGSLIPNKSPGRLAFSDVTLTYDFCEQVR